MEVKLKSVGCGVVEVRLNYPSLDVIFFSSQGHSSLLVFSINRIIGLLWETPLSHLLGVRSLFC
jgi:hypothetical protein